MHLLDFEDAPPLPPETESHLAQTKKKDVAGAADRAAKLVERIISTASENAAKSFQGPSRPMFSMFMAGLFLCWQVCG